MDRRWLSPPSAVRLGMALLATLALSGLTGIVLALAYDGSPERAHAVVASQVGGALGWVWSVHAWAATVVLVLALLHPTRAWVQGRLERVSNRTWWTGVGALSVLTLAFFTGTILPWDQQGWEALQHVQFGVSDVLGIHLFDPETPSQAPLGWVFYVHVFAVPGLLAAMLAVHLWRGTGLRQHARRVARLVEHGARWAWPVGVLVLALALAWPPLHGPAPVPRLQLTRPDWPFLWLVPIQDAWDSLGLWALPASLAGLAVLPLVPGDWSRSRRVLLVVLVAGGWGVLTLWGIFG